MMGFPDRRRFLKSTAGLAALGTLRPLLPFAAGAPRLAISIASLPAEPTILERFRIAVDAGFSGVEMAAVQNEGEAEEIREAADRSGLRIHSVVNAGGFPLSSADRAVVRQGVAAIEASLRNARLWGAGAVAVSPGTGAPNASYQDAWTRSQNVIRERILPLARDLGVALAVEEIWDGFLVGPPEVSRYVDAFSSPWVRACFDMRRSIFYAHPQDWIRAMGPRLINVRANIGEASVEWAAVRSSLAEISYDGWVTATFESTAAPVGDLSAALRRHLGA
jgi:L-ribulose-5-phosphate 3-epimerase